MGNITEIFKTNHIPTTGHFHIFFEAEAVLPYSGSVFFNILYPANANGFSAYGNSMFLVRAILLLLEIISIIKK